jgi:hypothetical protein
VSDHEGAWDGTPEIRDREDGPPEGAPPYVGELAYEIADVIFKRAREWQEDKVDLTHTIFIAEAEGPGLPEDCEYAGVAIGARGATGAQMPVTEMLNILAKTMQQTSTAAGLHDPFTELEAHRDALAGLIEAAQEYKRTYEGYGDGWFDRIRDRLSSLSRKREHGLLLMLNHYMEQIREIQNTGTIAEEPPDEIGDLDALKPEHFEG